MNYEYEIIFSWRDGESCFLLPDGVNREKFWLENEDKSIDRSSISDLNIEYKRNRDLEDKYYKAYPIHSFLAWMQEMKMMWYIDKINKIESNFLNFSDDEKILFLQLINSDILASVEKKSPVVELIVNKGVENFTIYRQEKGFEGEEYLSLYNGSSLNNDYIFMKKYRARSTYLKEMFHR